MLLDDAVDEFWLPEITEYEGKAFTSLTKGDVDLSRIEGGEQQEEPETPAELGKADRQGSSSLWAISVKDVRVSKRLKESAVCLVADDAGMDMRLERFLKQHNQVEKLGGRVLEINSNHELVKKMVTACR